jgi:beta-lactam-binding protein with PASTA domain
VSIANKGLSAIGKLLSVALLLAAFGVGLAGVVYVSLSGEEIKVPEIVGKDFVESEKELAALGLKIKKRADRASADPINTVLEQLPKPGETVKTGQMILVVVSKAGGEAEVPPSLKKDVEADDTEKIEEMISDKPKKAKSNSNSAKKKADTLRDTNANTSTSNSNSSEDGDKPATNPADKNRNTNPAKPGATPIPQKLQVIKPPAAKPPSGEPGRKPNDRQ